MIDTIRVKQQWEVIDSDHPEWTISYVEKGTKLLDDQFVVDEPSFKYLHKRTGVWCLGSKTIIRLYQASLCRVLFGENGMLIQNQEQLDDAFQKVQVILSTLGRPIDELPSFTRVDLVWHFPGNPHRYWVAHRNCKHPMGRRDEFQFEYESLRWVGRESTCSMYDKVRKELKKPGDFIRVEWQLHGGKLRQLFNGSRTEPLRHLFFADCYSVYRGLMLKFQEAHTITLRRGSRMMRDAEICALAAKEGWHSHHVSFFDIFTFDMERRSLQRLKKAMAAARPKIHKIDWAVLLPPDHPPINPPELQVGANNAGIADLDTMEVEL